MAISLKTGTLVIPGSNGNRSITGLGFRPKALILYGTNQTAVGYSDQVFSCLGISDGTTDNCIGWRLDDNINPNGFPAYTYPYTDQIWSADDGNATVVSFDADGFTLNWASIGSSSSNRLSYVAFGGATLSAKAGIINPNGTGNKSFTGVGFQPECLFLLHAHERTWNVEDASRVNLSFGVATSSSDQWSVDLVSFSGVNPSDDSSTLYTTRIDPWANGSLSSFDADGFTINWTNSGAGVNMAYLALADSAAGTTFKAGNETQKTSTGTKATSGVGLAPGSVLFAGICKATTGSVQSDDYLTIGSYDGSSSQCAWQGSTDGLGTTNTASRNSTSIVLSHSTPASTTNAEASVSSLDSDGFTLNWSTADATARAFGYLAIGSAGGTNPAGSLRLRTLTGVGL